jgi:threonine dehydratase
VSTGPAPTLDDVERAARALGDRIHRTPTFTSASLTALVGAPVRLKAELFQKTGSFKPRGVLTRLDALTPEERRAGVIGVSAGNHAQALAYACAREGIDCLVVMWRGASELKLAAARAYGARVDREAGGPPEAFERLEELCGDRVLVHPFDDALVVAGQGTVALELLEDVPETDTVIVPVGGGGLVAGVAIAVKAARPDARVVAVEPERAAALGAALAAGRPVPVAPDSIADGLNAPFAGTLPLAVCRELGVEHVTVTEEKIAAAFRLLYQRAKLAVEPAGAVGVAALTSGAVDVAGASAVSVVVSGGNVDARIASGILDSR